MAFQNCLSVIGSDHGAGIATLDRIPNEPGPETCAEDVIKFLTALNTVAGMMGDMKVLPCEVSFSTDIARRSSFAAAAHTGRTLQMTRASTEEDQSSTIGGCSSAVCVRTVGLGRWGWDCNLRNTAGGEARAQQAGEMRRAEYEVAANAAWEESLDPAWLAALTPDQANWQDGAESQPSTSSLMAYRN